MTLAAPRTLHVVTLFLKLHSFPDALETMTATMMIYIRSAAVSDLLLQGTVLHQVNWLYLGIHNQQCMFEKFANL